MSEMTWIHWYWLGFAFHLGVLSKVEGKSWYAQTFVEWLASFVMALIWPALIVIEACMGIGVWTIEKAGKRVTIE